MQHHSEENEIKSHSLHIGRGPRVNTSHTHSGCLTPHSLITLPVIPWKEGGGIKEIRKFQK